MIYEIEIIYLMNLIVTFWNCCFALFKSSLPVARNNRDISERIKFMARKGGVTIDGFTDFGTAICSCRPIEVIAVHAVNSDPNNPDYSRSSSFFISHSFSLSLPSFLHLILTPFLRDPTISRCYFAPAKRSAKLPPGTCYEGKLFEGRTRRQLYISTVHNRPHTRREHLQPT